MEERKKTRYWVSARREVPMEGKSWMAQVDVEISCPQESVLETTVTALRVKLVESNPGSAVAAARLKPEASPA